jgi:uracil-DNA glycosylase
MIYMERRWLDILKEEFNKPYMQELQNFLRGEMAKGVVIYPSKELIFNAFCQTPFDLVKVIIVGQDPYHGHNQAHGLSFSVPIGEKIPPSLHNIFKELVDDVGIEMPKSGCLLSWAKQGVLLLNATLTVEASKPMSHYGRGWEIFTDEVLKKLILKADPLVFMLWGKSAKEKYDRLGMKSNNKHLVLLAAHPSPYSAKGFLGCHHFSKANEFLKKHGKIPINWSIC